ncbi:MAG: polysaccharide biosynthesis/export family protein [Verrucomicrobiota bacterium]
MDRQTPSPCWWPWWPRASLAQAQDQLIPGAPSGAGAQTGGGSSTMGELPPVTVSSTYRLSPYDVIDMSVYGEEDLHTRARLGSDGTVLLQLIGPSTSRA